MSRAIALLLATLCAFLAAAESPKSLYNDGKKAEARQDYIAAYEAFAKAYQQKPQELKYRVAYQRMRFLAAAAHVNQGQKLRDEGKLEEAATEFDLANKIDPSSFIAAQELKRTRALIDATRGSPAQPAPPTPPSAISRRLEEAAGPVDLAPVSTQPITIEISNDSKLVYETIGKLAGVNILFDPDYTSRRISLKLNGVSLQEALDIVAFHSNTFWRPVTPNTLYVAANTKQKRQELEQSVLKTFYLSNISAPTDLQDVTNALRQILEMQKVQQVTAQNAIIVRGTPDQVALAEKIINDLDKAKPEVIVEVAILQVRRDKLRDLGIRPPTSVSVSLTGPTTTTTTGTGGTSATGTTTTTPTTTSTGSLNLNTFANLRASDFQVTIPTATASFLFSDSSTKLIQNPQIRSSDGVKASLKIGDKVPIATGSFGAGFSGGGLAGANGLVNTQFQYIDVGVNIDITPKVYSGREVGLKLMLDVSSVTGSSNIGGITQPIISQRKIEHDIRLKEGEVNLLGGIFEDQDTKSLSGIPGIGQLPFLKYFFAQDHTQRVENEIVFVLVPHIVRGQELSELNQRALDVGTGNALDLRRVPAKQPLQAIPAVPAQQTPVPITQMTQPQIQTTQLGGQTGQPPLATPTQSQPTNAPPSATTPPAATPQQNPVAALHIEPPTLTASLGENFSVQIAVSGGQDIYSAPMQISYDPKSLQVISISNGDLLSRDGQAVALVHREDVDAGVIQVNATRPPGAGGVTGSGVLYTITFQGKQKATSTLNIVRPMARNGQMQPMPLAPASAVINIK